MSLGVPHDIVKDLREKQGMEVINFQFLSGGCINPAVKLNSSKGTFFLKWNNSHAFPAMFEKEKSGLDLLTSTHTVKIPEVIAVGEAKGQAYLLLEFIEKGIGNEEAWANFGTQLGHLHRFSHPQFGLNMDNYIGSLPQSNKEYSNWTTFFIQERLLPQVKRGGEAGKISKELQEDFEKIYQKLEDVIPKTGSPALLHGDLWGGNVLIGQEHQPYIFDPAVYYGHREAELAYTHLFNPFPASFYHAYEEVFPLEKGAEERRDVFNLYPLLVHVNLFGGGYISQIKNILKRYVGE